MKTPQNAELEQRGRSMQSKVADQERARSLSTQPAFDSINSRLSKSNENLTQSTTLKPSSTAEPSRNERITKSEDRHLSNTVLNDLQIQRYNALKDKFEQRQPIDLLFGRNSRMQKPDLRFLVDPRRYPFKILSPNPYPLVNTDIHLLSMCPSNAMRKI